MLCLRIKYSRLKELAYLSYDVLSLEFQALISFLNHWIENVCVSLGMSK